MILVRSYYILLMLGFVMALGACKSTGNNSESKAVVKTGVKWANPWTEEDARVWYKTTEGSHMIHWDIFMAMEQANSDQLFATKENLKKYGFVYPEDPTYASYQQTPELPLGLVKDKKIVADKGEYLGFNCAACHTGEIQDNGQRILIHGGTTMAHIDIFLRDVRNAIIANRGAEKYARMKARIAANPSSTIVATLDRDFKTSLDHMDAIRDNSAPVIAYGPGRLDAVGSILNAVSAEFTGIASNRKSIQAPVSTPIMWRVPEMACVQTNCLATNPLTRNIGQVLGAFGHINLKEVKGIPNNLELLVNKIFHNELFESTPQIPNLYRIEESLKTMKAPTWEANFGALDTNLVAAGERVYNTNCVSCHVNIKGGLNEENQTAANKVGHRFIKVVKVPRDEIGTDPTFLNDYAGRMSDPGIMGDVLVKLDPTTKKRPAELSGLKLLGLTTIVISEKFFKSEEFKSIAARNAHAKTPQEAVADTKNQWINFQVDSGDLRVPAYKARPLDGIAFSAPYLHNGSVRTLREVLEKPDTRAKAFHIGNLAYDKQNVGYVDQGDFVFDTSIPGNGNQGHLYGTDLSAGDKVALLEYLKSL